MSYVCELMVISHCISVHVQVGTRTRSRTEVAAYVHFYLSILELRFQMEKISEFSFVLFAAIVRTSIPALV